MRLLTRCIITQCSFLRAVTCLQLEVRPEPFGQTLRLEVSAITSRQTVARNCRFLCVVSGKTILTVSSVTNQSFRICATAARSRSAWIQRQVKHESAFAHLARLSAVDATCKCACSANVRTVLNVQASIPFDRVLRNAARGLMHHCLCTFCAFY